MAQTQSAVRDRPEAHKLPAPIPQLPAEKPVAAGVEQVAIKTQRVIPGAGAGHAELAIPVTVARHGDGRENEDADKNCRANYRQRP